MSGKHGGAIQHKHKVSAEELTDKQLAAIIMATRWATDDLSGHVVEINSRAKMLAFPAIMSQKRRWCQTCTPKRSYPKRKRALETTSGQPCTSSRLNKPAAQSSKTSVCSTVCLKTCRQVSTRLFRMTSCWLTQLRR